MRTWLKVLNPFIWMLNNFSAASWYMPDSPMRNEPYDYSTDIKYF